MDNLTLGELFLSGKRILTELEETALASIDPQYQAKVRDGLNRLERANQLVQVLAVFSSNEIVDDVNTEDLQYLLIPIFLGDLTLKVTDPNLKRRLILESAKNYFDTYLNMCEEYQLIRPEELRMYKNKQENAPVRLSAGQQRQQKIDQFKREKAVENQIKELRTRLDESTKEQSDWDDMERDLVLSTVQLYIIKALQHLTSVEQELVMVKEMEAMAEDRRRMPEQRTEQPDRRIPPPTWGRDKPLLSKEGRPLQPFVITNRREDIAKQVFRPGHSLPTMTIDQYLEQEEERGNIIRGGYSPPEKEEIDDNDHEALDADVMKKREWDEFVEANPKGWGNRGNKG
ncbi:TAP42-like protein [Fennellomyces sp. T-0311]|nr:TAP42-like protein [Fennellomyces sp. T-0311]